MGLKKTIEMQTGENATYWNIGSCSIDYRNNKTTITLFGYILREARLANKQPVDVRYVVVDEATDVSRAACYAHIKETADFIDAIDD